jgi:hypothetical protein
MKKGVRIALAVIAAAVLLGVVAFVAWGLTPLGPADEGLAAMESDANVTVRDEGEFIAFAPAAQAPVTGFILYPGGHVDHRSYAPVAREIAERGYLVAVVRMPLSLAVFGIDRADGVIAAHPAVRHWVVGGHSLGGSMAASYARSHTESVRGLALWAAYPAAGDDLSATGLKGLSTWGSNDLVVNRENLDASLGLLPPGTVVQVIEGGNHAQFGNYGPQPGDGEAAISAAEQQARAADLTVDLLRAVEGD